MSTLRKLKKVVVAAGLTVTTTVWLASAVLMAPTALAYSDGDLLKDAASANIYVVNNGMKVWVRSAAVFDGCGYDWAKVKTISNLSSTPTADLIKSAANPDVYRLEKNFKRKLASIEIFQSYSLDWNKVGTVCQNVLDSYSKAPLIQQTGSADIYWVQTDTLKHKMTSWQSFVDNGFNIADVIGINSMEMGSYSEGAAVYATIVNPPATGNVTVSAASDNPGTAVLVRGAANVLYLKINLVAGSAATIDSITITLKGSGAAADFSNVYLYEGDARLTSGRTISAQTRQASFPNLALSIGAGSTRTISVIAEMSASATVADENWLEISAASDIAAGGTVGGSFPVKGGAMTVSGQTAGTITAASSGTPSNPYVGSKESEIAVFKLTAGTAENINVKRLIITNGGSTASSNITNLKLYRGSDVLATAAAMSSDRVTFVLNTPELISKGQNKVFSVKADLGGRPTETIIMYFDYTTDIYATGASFPVGTTVTNTFGSAYATTLVLQGGVVTASWSGPNSTTIKKTADNADMMDFSLNATNNVEVRSTKVYLCWDDAGGGTYTDMTANVLSEINDVKVIDKDTGATIAGSTDGSGFTLTANTDDTCATNKIAAYKVWTDYYNVNAGQTRNFSVTLDLAASSYLAATDKIKVVLDDFADANDIKYVDVNNYVAVTDVVPTDVFAGNAMTLAAASMTAAVSATPISDTYVKNTTGASALGIIWTAGTAKDVKITSMTLTAYVADTNYTSLTKDTDGTVTASTLISKVNLYEEDGTTLISGPKSVDSDGLAAFSGMNWNVPAGTSKKMIVKVDTGSNAPQNGALDYVAFDIAANANVTMYDSDANQVDYAFGTGINGTISSTVLASPTVYLTLSSGGKIYITPASDTPTVNIVIMGSSNVLMSKFQVAATNVEAFQIKKITMDNAASSNDDEIAKVWIEYPGDAAGTIYKKDGQLSGGEFTITLAGTTAEPYMYVPKNSKAYLRVYANINTLGLGADSGAVPSFSWSRDQSAIDQFEAIGLGSNTQLKDDSTSIYFDGATNDVSVAGAAMTIRQTKPTFTAGQIDKTYTLGSTLYYKFKVKADSAYDVDLKKFKFDVLVTDANTTTALTVGGSGNYYLYNVTDDPGMTTDLAANAKSWANGVAVDTGDPSFTNSTTIQTLLCEPDSEIVVPYGTEKEFAVKFVVSGITSTSTEYDVVEIGLASETGTTDTGAITSNTTSLVLVNGTAASYAWSDGSAGATTHSGGGSHIASTASSDWTNGYMVVTLPSTRTAWQAWK